MKRQIKNTGGRKNEPAAAYPDAAFRAAHVARRNSTIVRRWSYSKGDWLTQLIQEVGLDGIAELTAEEVAPAAYAAIQFDTSDPLEPLAALRWRCEITVKKFVSALGETATATDAAQKRELEALVKASAVYEKALRGLSDASIGRILAASKDEFAGICDWNPHRAMQLLADATRQRALAARLALKTGKKPTGSRPPVAKLRRALIVSLGQTFDFFYSLLVPADEWDAAVRSCQDEYDLPAEMADSRATFVWGVVQRFETPGTMEHQFAGLPKGTLPGKSVILDVLGRRWQTRK